MLQQLCNKISIFLLQIKQAFAVSFDHSKINRFFVKKDDFWVTIWYVRAIYRTNKWNIVSINWFLNAFWPTSLHYHQLVCFLTHFASIYFHASAVTMPSGRSVSILFTKWIFDNLVDPFSKFLLFTSGMRTTRPVHGAPIHTWSKFDLFWKTSTSPSLASSINQSNRKQAADCRKITKKHTWLQLKGWFFILFVSGNENVNHHSPNCPTYCPTQCFIRHASEKFDSSRIDR